MLATSQARAQSGVWSEQTLGVGAAAGTAPVDCATSHNNNRGAVRYANSLNDDAVIGVWNLGDPSNTTPPGTMVVFGAGNVPGLKSGAATSFLGVPYLPSDRIELGSQWGVSIGSGVNGSIEENYIELFQVSGTPTWVDQRIRPLGPVPSGEEPYLTGGHAHDVAITRDGEWAVVNADNWIHVIRLDSNVGFPQYDFNIGKSSYATGDPITWNRPCTPNGAVDSVVVTNDRAVVTTGRRHFPDNTGPFTTWVYILDLSDTSSTPIPRIVLEHEIDIEGNTTGLGDGGDRPHDLAVTPHTDIQNSGFQTLAVVTSRHAVAAFNLVNNTFLSSEFFKDEVRDYQWQVDSVEMTGKSAVVLADLDTPTGLRWQVKMYGLSNVLGLVSGPIYPDPSAVVVGRAHDLAIERDHDVGLVRTSFDNIFINNLSSPPPSPVVVPSPNGADAHEYLNFSQSVFHPVFSSDSVAIGWRQDGGRLMAVTIGARTDALGNRLGEADILHIDVNAPPHSVSSITPVQITSGGAPGCVPLDLAIGYSANSYEIVIRSADPHPENPSTTGADLTRISLNSSVPPPAAPVYAILQKNGGNGFPFATDALAVPSLSGVVQTSKWMLSVSQDDFLQKDYVHLAK